MISFKNKTVLVIGSGADLDGRRLGKKIDSGHWDVVIRVNKMVGQPADIGSRMDILITRFRKWVPRFFPFPVAFDELVCLNEEVGISALEMTAAAIEANHDRASAGLIACMWALNRHAARVDAIGFGYSPATGFSSVKKYAVSKKIDNNPLYNWQNENEWLKKNVNLI